LSVAPSGNGKALGLHWDTDQDQFHVSTSDVSQCSVVSERTVSSVVARIFDIMGWFALAILLAKFLLQEAWYLQGDWDDPFPDGLQQQWKLWL